jgi:hypothetical protein
MRRNGMVSDTSRRSLLQGVAALGLSDTVEAFTQKALRMPQSQRTKKTT